MHPHNHVPGPWRGRMRRGCNARSGGGACWVVWGGERMEMIAAAVVHAVRTLRAIAQTRLFEREEAYPSNSV